MTDAVAQIEARIHQIQRLLGEQPAPNGSFGEALNRAGAAPAPAAMGAAGRVSALDPPASVQPLIAAAAGRTGVAPELISAVMAAESGFQPGVVSPAGALGLMQLMPGTAQSLGITDPLDPLQNVLGGSATYF